MWIHTRRRIQATDVSRRGKKVRAVTSSGDENATHVYTVRVVGRAEKKSVLSDLGFESRLGGGRTKKDKDNYVAWKKNVN